MDDSEEPRVEIKLNNKKLVEKGVSYYFHIKPNNEIYISRLSFNEN
jgi:hypothetical protein